MSDKFINVKNIRPDQFCGPSSISESEPDPQQSNKIKEKRVAKNSVKS